MAMMSRALRSANWSFVVATFPKYPAGMLPTGQKPLVVPAARITSRAMMVFMMSDAPP
jgi:hypothetical protein